MEALVSPLAKRMEPPISFEADAVRDEQTKILRAVQPLTPEGRLESPATPQLPQLCGRHLGAEGSG